MLILMFQLSFHPKPPKTCWSAVLAPLAQSWARHPVLQLQQALLLPLDQLRRLKMPILPTAREAWQTQRLDAQRHLQWWRATSGSDRSALQMHVAHLDAIEIVQQGIFKNKLLALLT
eukprot:SAG31_NODE_27196_length_430_cov_0.619335_1_plen_116_part_01